jgi:hypothetical protein
MVHGSGQTTGSLSRRRKFPIGEYLEARIAKGPPAWPDTHKPVCQPRGFCNRESSEQARIDRLLHPDERDGGPTGRVDYPLEWPEPTGGVERFT